MQEGIKELYRAAIQPHHIRYIHKQEGDEQTIHLVLHEIRWDVHSCETWRTVITLSDGAILTNFNAGWETT